MKKQLWLLLCLVLLSGCGRELIPSVDPDLTPAATSSPTPAPTPTPEAEEQIELYGETFSSLSEELELSGRGIQDTGELECALPRFSRLRRVDLCDNPVRDSDMAALEQQYPEIRFVWTVYVKENCFPSDTTWYVSYNLPKSTRIHNTDALRYCHDLIALDLGHVTVSDMSILYDLPQLRYLILAGVDQTDLNAIGEMKELKWLEIFQTWIGDPTALVGCTALEDLNVCYVFCPGDTLYETLRQMTWLKRLWCCGCGMTEQQLASLREALPDCEIWDKAGDESTGFTWRYHEDYYEMRDAFHMYYMDIKGNRTQRKTEEEIDEMYAAYGLRRPVG